MNGAHSLARERLGDPAGVVIVRVCGMNEFLSIHGKIKSRARSYTIEPGCGSHIGHNTKLTKCWTCEVTTMTP